MQHVRDLKDTLRSCGVQEGSAEEGRKEGIKITFKYPAQKTEGEEGFKEGFLEVHVKHVVP